MARNTVNYTIAEEGRDKGKVFILTEMSCEQAESWAFRTMLALMASGVDLPSEDFQLLGMAGIAELGFKALAGVNFEVAKPILDEMMECVAIIPDPRKTHVHRPLVESDIEEVATRLKIRLEVWKLHVGFLKAGAPSNHGLEEAPGVLLKSTKTIRG